MILDYYTTCILKKDNKMKINLQTNKLLLLSIASALLLAGCGSSDETVINSNPNVLSES